MIARAVKMVQRGRYVMSYGEDDDPLGGCHMDSHADTCVGGANMVLLDGTVTRHVKVSPFSDQYEAIKGVPIGTCATAYDSPEDGLTYIFVCNETLYFGDQLSHSLLCPNQIRAAGNVVEDTPRQFDRRSSHGIALYDSENEEELFIKLKLDSVISLFDTRKPTKQEL